MDKNLCPYSSNFICFLSVFGYKGGCYVVVCAIYGVNGAANGIIALQTFFDWCNIKVVISNEQII